MSGDGSRIDRRLAAARAGLARVPPERLALELAAGAFVVDLRPESNRRDEGDLPGAVVIERIHLEWRLDPTSDARVPEARDDLRVILVCNEGYSSSLAAADLQALGLARATDLEGGYRAWKALPVGAESTEAPATHSGTAASGTPSWLTGLLTFGGLAV